MKCMHLCVLFILVLGILVCGCTDRQAPVPATPAPTVQTATIPVTPTTPAYPPQLAGKWVLKTMAVQGGSVPLTPTTEISLNLNADGSATGWGGCNNYFATYNLTGAMTPKGNSMSFGPISTSKMHCQATSDQENTYLQTLQNTGAYVVNGYLMTLTDKSQNALVFQQSTSIVTTPYYPQPA